MSETLTLPPEANICTQTHRSKTSAMKRFLRRLTASQYPTYLMVCQNRKDVGGKEFYILNLEQVQADNGKNYIIAKINSYEKALEIECVLHDRPNANVYKIERLNGQMIASHVGQSKNIQQAQVA